MSRFPSPAGTSDHEPEPIEKIEEIEEIEELGDEAIIAQQSQAHLPQKRARVSDDSRSIVISDDPPPNSRRTHAYRERATPTLVIRDRRELERMHKEILRSKRGPSTPRRVPWVWAGLAIVAFAAGGIVTLVLVQGSKPATSLDLELTKPGVVSGTGNVSRREASRAEPEPATPPVKLEELPLEKPARRRSPSVE